MRWLYDYIYHKIFMKLKLNYNKNIYFRFSLATTQSMFYKRIKQLSNFIRIHIKNTCSHSSDFLLMLMEAKILELWVCYYGNLRGNL